MSFKRTFHKRVTEILHDGRQVLDLPMGDKLMEFVLTDPLRDVQHDMAAQVAALHFMAAVQDGASRIRFDASAGLIHFVYSNGDDRRADMVTPGALVLTDMIREIVRSSKATFLKPGTMSLRCGSFRRELIVEYVKETPMTLEISGFNEEGRERVQVD